MLLVVYSVVTGCCNMFFLFWHCGKIAELLENYQRRLNESGDSESDVNTDSNEMRKLQGSSVCLCILLFFRLFANVHEQWFKITVFLLFEIRDYAVKSFKGGTLHICLHPTTTKVSQDSRGGPCYRLDRCGFRP